MEENKYQQLFNLFHTAGKHLKYPKITFTASSGNNSRVQLYLATKGYIAIKVNGEYVGKIDSQYHSFRMYQGTTELQSEVMAFCMEPLKSAIVKGQQYSNCCFCRLELTNKASVQMGYGPICAENYGLPWEYTEPELANFDGKTIPFHKNDQY